jgi:hypothetical protein
LTRRWPIFPSGRGRTCECCHGKRGWLERVRRVAVLSGPRHSAPTPMLVGAYGSDNSDGSGDEHTPPQSNKSTSLPGSSRLTLPAPKAKKPPKKIAIDLPALPKDDPDNRDSDEIRPAKKPRTETRGAGSSALFSRLPAPKLAAPVKVAPERVLGGGNGPGLVFTNPPPRKTQETFGTPPTSDSQSSLGVMEETSVSLPFTPVSVMKGKANISLEESSVNATANPLGSSPPTTVDLFSLSTSYYLPIHF